MISITDAIVVGAGLAGAAAARRLAEQGRRVLLLEQRAFLGGNAHDRFDGHGILIHRYGPHIFHTDDTGVWDFLSRFTEWRYYEHKVLADVRGVRMPVPFNLNALKTAFPEEHEALGRLLLARYGEGKAVSVLTLRDSGEPRIQRVAEYVYHNIFHYYTQKQWGHTPGDMDYSVVARVPVRFSYDDRYFQNVYQGIPGEGYTKLLENMLRHRNIELRLNTAARFQTGEGRLLFEGSSFDGIVVYTGSLDELFGLRFGRLPYRTLDFVFENHPIESFQACGTINYTADKPYTRITEFKHLTGQKADSTTILKEFPKAFTGEAGQIPCYPVPSAESAALYERYRALCRAYGNLVLLGRLAEYRYFDMDAAVKRALEWSIDFEAANNRGSMLQL